MRNGRKVAFPFRIHLRKTGTLTNKERTLFLSAYMLMTRFDAHIWSGSNVDVRFLVRIGLRQPNSNRNVVGLVSVNYGNGSIKLDQAMTVAIVLSEHIPHSVEVGKPPSNIANIQTHTSCICSILEKALRTTPPSTNITRKRRREKQKIFAKNKLQKQQIVQGFGFAFKHSWKKLLSFRLLDGRSI